MANGEKQRTVYMNDKVVVALQEYLKERKSDSPYLFPSRQSNKISRSRMNQIFNKYSNVLTPHRTEDIMLLLIWLIMDFRKQKLQ